MHDSPDNNAFTPAAAALWQRIPAQAQAKLLANVWCSHCGRVIGITDFRGEVVGGDLVLTGACPVCGATVKRLIESESERCESTQRHFSLPGNEVLCADPFPQSHTNGLRYRGSCPFCC